MADIKDNCKIEKGLVILFLLCMFFGGCTNMENTKRYGMALGVKKEKIDEYKKLHAAVWPDILKIIEECNIRNYSIYLGQLERDKYYLFSYFEYIGKDYDADMKKLAAYPIMQKWWDVCIPCQQPIEFRAEGEWWMNMEEVFHTD